MATDETTSTTDEQAEVRETGPEALLRDAGYALAGLTDDALDQLRNLPTRLDELRSETPERLRELGSDAPDRLRRVPGTTRAALHNQREHYEARLRELREAAAERVDARREALQEELGRHADHGREVAEELRSDERYAQVSEQLQAVLDQTRSTRRQFKAAFTSVRKTADAAAEAGREQAGKARSQVKAAATSARKSARAVVDAGRELTG